MTHKLHINHCYFVTHRLRKRDFIQINQKMKIIKLNWRSWKCTVSKLNIFRSWKPVFALYKESWDGLGIIGIDFSSDPDRSIKDPWLKTVFPVFVLIIKKTKIAKKNNWSDMHLFQAGTIGVLAKLSRRVTLIYPLRNNKQLDRGLYPIHFWHLKILNPATLKSFGDSFI